MTPVSKTGRVAARDDRSCNSISDNDKEAQANKWGHQQRPIAPAMTWSGVNQACMLQTRFSEADLLCSHSRGFPGSKHLTGIGQVGSGVVQLSCGGLSPCCLGFEEPESRFDALPREYSGLLTSNNLLYQECKLALG